MRYPSVPDIHYVIHLALHIRDPLNYSEPVGYSSLVMPNIGADLTPPGGPPPAARQLSNNSPKNDGPVTARRPNTLAVDGVVGKQAADTGKKRTGSGRRTAAGAVAIVANELTHIAGLSPKTSTARAAAGDGGIDDDWVDDLRPDSGSGSGGDQRLRHTIDYCCQHMSVQLEALQRALAGERLTNEDQAMVAVAELKRCRDLLKGTLRFPDSNQ